MNIGPAIGIGIGFAIGGLINALISKKAKKAAEKLSDEERSQLGKRFTIRQPRARLGASIFLVVLFCGGPSAIFVFAFDELIEFLNTAATVWEIVLPIFFMLVVFLPLMLFAVWCLLRAAVWKIQVDGERIVSISFLGKKTEFTFKDITEIKPYKTKTGHAIRVYVAGKKVFAVDQGCENFFILMSRLGERESGVPE